MQDFDRLATAKDSTSVLTRIDQAGRIKTREMAAWAAARGFQTRLMEQRFAGDIVLGEDDPRVLFCGVTTPRRAQPSRIRASTWWWTPACGGRASGVSRQAAARLSCLRSQRATQSESGTSLNRLLSKPAS